MNNIEYALRTAVFYNGYDDLLREWANIKLAIGEIMLFKPDLNCSDWDAAQVEIIWMMLVAMFGEWGTSPRSGWIVDIDGFKTFLKQITEV